MNTERFVVDANIFMRRGFSPRSLKYMSTFAAVWPNRHFVQQVAAQIP